MLSNSESSNKNFLKKLPFSRFSIISAMDFMPFIKTIFLYLHNARRVDENQRLVLTYRYCISKILSEHYIKIDVKLKVLIKEKLEFNQCFIFAENL